MNFKTTTAAFGIFLGTLGVFLPARGEGPSQALVTSISLQCPDPEIRKSAEEFFSPLLQKPVSPEEVAERIRRFYFRGPISTIRVDQETGEAGITLTIAIAVNPILSEFELEGVESISEEDLLESIDIQRGDKWLAGRSESVRMQIESYYAFRGFPKAKAEVDVRMEEEGRSGVLIVAVKEGDPCTISGFDLDTEKSAAISEEKVLDLLDAQAGDRCDGSAIQKGVRRIETTLRKEGRLSAEVNDPELLYDTEGKTAKLKVRIQPGPTIRVLFVGNTFAFERSSVLAREIALESERRFSRTWAETAAREAIIDFYRLKGYPDATVQVSDSLNENNDERTIRFEIGRGRVAHLGEVVFQGNQNISSEDLEKYFRGTSGDQTRKRRFVENELLESAETLGAFYNSKGYLRANVPPPRVTRSGNGGKANVVFQVEEGERSTLAGFEIVGNQVFEKSEIEQSLGLQPGQPINMETLLLSANRLEARYRSKGYRFASVQFPPVHEIPTGDVMLPVTIQEGPPVKFGVVSIRGNLATNEKVIRRELRIKEGTLYDPDRLADSRRNLVRLGFFQRVTVEELEYDPETGKEDILITVIERKKRNITIRPGFSTDDGARLAVILGYVNIAGTGRSATVSGRVNRQIENADITEHQVVFTYREPRIFNVVDGRVNFIEERSEEQQFDLDRQSVILAVERQERNWLRSTLQWELEYRQPFHVDPAATLNPLDEEAARFGSVATIFDFDRRDDLLNPQKGSLHRLRFSLYDDTFLSEADFYQVHVTNSFYQHLFRGVRMVAAVRLGFSATFDDTAAQGIDEIPIEKRFRLGGNNSLRGFSRNCVGGLAAGVPETCSDDVLEQAPGGNSVFNYMVDLLFPLGKGVDLALFTDGGNAYLSNSDFDITNIRNTAGFGLRYNTFFGPLRLDYGIKLDRRESESFGEIHFAVGQL